MPVFESPVAQANLAYTPFDPSTIAGFGGSIVNGMAGPSFDRNAVFGKSVNSTGPMDMTGVKGILARSGLGMNMPTFGLAINGLQTLGSLWAAYNAQDIAKKQLNFSKGIANANLANQTQAYNTSIADRARSRGVVEGQSASQVADYITQNSLAKRTVG